MSTENPSKRRKTERKELRAVKVDVSQEKLSKIREGETVRLEVGGIYIRAHKRSGRLIADQAPMDWVTDEEDRARIPREGATGRLVRRKAGRGAIQGFSMERFPARVNPSPREALIRRLSSLISDAPDAVIAQALSEDDVGTLVTLATEEAWGRELTGVEKARLRGVKYRAQLIERAGGALTVDQVAHFLGVGGEAVRKAIRSGSLIAFPGAKGYALPAVQFEEGRELKGLRRVLRAMPIESPWMRLDWLLSPEPRLGGRVPTDLLRAGKDIDQAEQAAELVGEQGAA